MFGFSFSELVVVAVVALLIFGPKELPSLLRRLGRYAGQIRRAAADLRVQSGIDDALRTEGLAEDIAEIRKLARGELDAVRRVAEVQSAVSAAAPIAADPYTRNDSFFVVRDREYPRECTDSYHALPDNAVVYVESMPKSVHARDPLYVLGDADAELPPEAPASNDPGAVQNTIIGGIGLAPVASESPAEGEPVPHSSSSTAEPR